MECPKKTCAGTMEVWGSGQLANGMTVEWAICEGCGHLATIDPEEVEHPSLFGEGAA